MKPARGGRSWLFSLLLVVHEGEGLLSKWNEMVRTMAGDARRPTMVVVVCGCCRQWWGGVFEGVCWSGGRWLMMLLLLDAMKEGMVAVMNGEGEDVVGVAEDR
jgi:hypothetical protein